MTLLQGVGVEADSAAVSVDWLLQRGLAGLAAIESRRLRARREAALGHFAAHVELWKEATQLAAERAAPPVGETIELDPDSRWMVVKVQTVKPAPAYAPDRDYFVCAQSA